MKYKIIISLLVSLIILVSYIYISHERTIIVSADNIKEEQIKLPIIMYHSLLKERARSGKYIITPDLFDRDMAYISSKGYKTINMTDLIDYVYNNKKLPDKPIIITFDDGYYNNLEYAVPILKKYDMKAVVSVVGEYTDKYSKTGEVNTNYSYMRWQDINDLINDGVIEFQNHSYDMHGYKNGRQGTMKKKWESSENYSAVLNKDLGRLQDRFKEETGYMPNTFTYPFGAVSKDSKEVIKEMGFKASLSCTSGINIITKDTNCLFLLKRNNRQSGISTVEFFKNILN